MKSPRYLSKILIPHYIVSLRFHILLVVYLSQLIAGLLMFVIFESNLIALFIRMLLYPEDLFFP